jgi:uncharacterized protein (TIGR02996 family)
MTDAARHPEGRRLLWACCERPRDDVPRLVLADWLEEHGDAARAEYVRGAVRLAGMKVGHPDYGKLRERVRRLEWEGKDGWLWPLPELFTDVEWLPAFERGLAAFLQAPVGAFVRGAGAAFAYHPITYVVLRSNSLTLGGHAGPGLDAMYDAAMTGRGVAHARLPGALFPYLTRTGLACDLRGAEARFPVPVNGQWVVSRAAVAYGRDRAGLPPLEWEN